MSEPYDPRATHMVPCPNCRQSSHFASSNAYRPFCSERCKLMDFGAWAAEQFRVAQKPNAADLPDIEAALQAAKDLTQRQNFH